MFPCVFYKFPGCLLVFYWECGENKESYGQLSSENPDLNRFEQISSVQDFTFNIFTL